MSARPSLKDEITMVERRIEMRRGRLTRHVDEAKAVVEARAAKAARWWPAAAVGGALAIGLAVARYPRPSIPRFSAPPPPPPHTTRNVMATVLGVGAMLIRFATSPEARAFLHAVRAARARP